MNPTAADAQPTLCVPIQRLPHAADLPLPAYQSDDAAGMDLHAAIDQPIELAPGAIELIPCGFALAVPPGHEAQIRPRSGLAMRHGLTPINSPGTIDADYRGEVKVPMVNHGQSCFTIEPAMRIAQMLILPVPRVQWAETGDLPPTGRGEGGFGHSGV